MQSVVPCCCGPQAVCTAGIPRRNLRMTWVQSTLGFPDCTNTATLFYRPGVVIGSSTMDAWTSPVIRNCGSSRQDTIIELTCSGGEMSLTLSDPTGVVGLFIIVFTTTPFLIQAVDTLFFGHNQFFTISL